jgi:hypothetical protein
VESFKLQQAEIPISNPEIEQDYTEQEAAYEAANFLISFHQNVHPEWDDMTLNAWLHKQPTDKLIALEQYLQYVSSYIGYNLKGRENQG